MIQLIWNTILTACVASLHFVGSDNWIKVTIEIVCHNFDLIQLFVWRLIDLHGHQIFSLLAFSNVSLWGPLFFFYFNDVWNYLVTGNVVSPSLNIILLKLKEIELSICFLKCPKFIKSFSRLLVKKIVPFLFEVVR